MCCSATEARRTTAEELHTINESGKRNHASLGKHLNRVLLIMLVAIFIIGVVTAMGHLNGIVGGWCVAGLSLPLGIGMGIKIAGGDRFRPLRPPAPSEDIEIT